MKLQIKFMWNCQCAGLFLDRKSRMLMMYLPFVAAVIAFNHPRCIICRGPSIDGSQVWSPWAHPRCHFERVKGLR